MSFVSTRPAANIHDLPTKSTVGMSQDLHTRREIVAFARQALAPWLHSTV